MLRLSAREGVFLQMRGRQVRHARQRREDPLVVRDAADRDAAEVDAVIALLAANEPGPVPLPARLVVGERDLQRGVDALGPRVGEEHMVEALGRHVAQRRRQFESQRMPHLERGRIVQLPRLALDRLGDLRAAMTRVAAPEARRSVEDLTAVGGGIMHVLRGHEHPGRLLELPVRGERHPECGEIIGTIERHGQPRSESENIDQMVRRTLAEG